MKTVTINGIEMVQIMEFTAKAGRSITGTRYLIEHGNTIRKMLYYRDRSKLYIPVTEIHGFPFITPGSGTHREVFHYDESMEKVLCPECTFSDGCEKRKLADSFVNKEWDYGDA